MVNPAGVRRRRLVLPREVRAVSGMLRTERLRKGTAVINDVMMLTVAFVRRFDMG